MRRRERGFSLIELLIVVAIILVVAAIATPNITAAIANLKLRTAATNLSSLLQQSRMLSIRDNTPYRLGLATQGNATLIYIDTNRNGQRENTEPVVQMPGTVVIQTNGAPSNTTMSLNFTPQSPNTPPSFNARGIPCVLAGAVCNTTVGGNAVGFLYYFTDTRPLGQSGWAAVSVTPAGRTKVWVWQGSRWGD